MSDWIIIKTKRSKEFWAKENLIRQKFDVYIPLTYRIKKVFDKIKTTKSPLFEGYIFVKNESLDFRLLKINNTMGVSSVLSFSNKKSVLPGRYIEKLKLLEDNNGIISILKFKKLIEGKIYKILHGPFKGLNGMFHQALNNKNIILILNILGKDLNLKLPRNYIAIS